MPPLAVTYYGWGTPSSPAYPTPGSGVVPFTVEVVANPTTGGSPASVVPPVPRYAELNLSGSPLTNSTGGLVALAAPTPTGSSYYFTFYLNVSGAAPGTYQATLTIYYSYTYAYASSGQQSASIYYYQWSDNLSVPVYPNPEPEVSVSAPKIVEGREGTIVVNVTDMSPAALQDLQVVVGSQLPLSGGNTSSIPYLAPGSSASFRFGILATGAPGYYPVQVTVSYACCGSARSSTYYSRAEVVAQVGGLSALASPASIPYQRNDTLSITITNEMGGAVRDLQVVLQPSPYLYVAQGYGPFDLGELGPGESRSINLSVVPVASAPGPVQLQLQASYLGPGGAPEQASLAVPVYLTGIADVSFSQVGLAGPAYPGGQAQVSGILVNTGTDSAYYGFLLLSGPIVQGYQPVYIGNLPVNSPTPFSASFTVPPGTAPGTYPVNVTFSYQDELGQQHSASYLLAVQVLNYSQPAAQVARRPPGTLAWILVAAVIVAAALAALAAERRRARGVGGA
ncbi:MAG: hypothetical protein RXQ62_04395 [Nitrososphaeria archaeon]